MKIKFTHRIAVYIAASLALAIASGIYAQSKKGYELSENQKLRLQLKQKDAQIAQIQLSIAQDRFQQSIAQFNAESKAIEKENSWPETLVIDPNTLEFRDPPAPPAPLKHDGSVPVLPMDKGSDPTPAKGSAK
jgi:hypothetical protein